MAGIPAFTKRSLVMPACCICYTTDPTYLFPTFVSAMQARRHGSAAKADVVIFSWGADNATERTFRRVCDAERVQFVSMSIDAIDGAAVMLARLFLTRFAPVQYEHFVYIDGDTQIRGSLDPLIDAPVPAGQFMAANDPMTFVVPGGGSFGREIERHLSSIGIPPNEASTYFNTGVLRINRDGWGAIGLSAWELFQANRKASRFPDQDVLNVVGRAARIPMSLAWNFPVFMRNSRVEAEITPRVYHFMSNPKPWQGVFPPWGRDSSTPYAELIAKYPDLAQYRATMPLRTQARYHLQQRYKKAFETISWGLGERRARILAYETGLAALSTRARPVAAASLDARQDICVRSL
jgi:lipopolysaccharide biosynthesis glycosyltransferase